MDPDQVADAEYWRTRITPLVHHMLKSSRKYTPGAIASHTAFIDTHLIPHLGPRPTQSPIPFFAHRHPDHGYHNSPLEVSFSFNYMSCPSNTGVQPIVRFAVKTVGHSGGTPADPLAQDAAWHAFESLAAATPGADLSWARQFQQVLFLAPEEVERVRAGSGSICSWSVGFDLWPTGERMMKAYFAPMLKAAATGKGGLDMAMDVIRKLRVPHDVLGFEPAVKVLQSYIEGLVFSTPHCVLVGVDCSSPLSKLQPVPRVKLYILIEGTKFSTTKDVLTLGGRLNDEATVQGLQSLRQCWHLLLDEPDGIPDDAVEKWSKPRRKTGDPMTGFMYSVEITAKKEVPQVKMYVPVYQYARDTRTAVRNLGHVMEVLGVGWDGWDPFWSDEAIDWYFQSIVSAAIVLGGTAGLQMTTYFTQPVFDG